MPLFRVEDNDRPAFVVARTYAEAVEKWEAVVREENDGEVGDPPKGVAYICDDDELIGLLKGTEAKAGSTRQICPQCGTESDMHSVGCTFRRIETTKLTREQIEAKRNSLLHVHVPDGVDINQWYDETNALCDLAIRASVHE